MTEQERKEYQRKYREQHSPWHNLYRASWYIPFNPHRLIDNRRYDKNLTYLILWMQKMRDGNGWMFGGNYEV